MAKASTCFMEMTDKTSQIQEAVIKNLDNQMGQMAKVLSERVLWALPSDIEISPKQHLIAMSIVKNEIIGDSPMKAPTPVQAITM